MDKKKNGLKLWEEKHKFRDCENALMCTFFPPSNHIIMMRAHHVSQRLFLWKFFLWKAKYPHIRCWYWTPEWLFEMCIKWRIFYACVLFSHLLLLMFRNARNSINKIKIHLVPAPAADKRLHEQQQLTIHGLQEQKASNWFNNPRNYTNLSF